MYFRSSIEGIMSDNLVAPTSIPLVGSYGAPYGSLELKMTDVFRTGLGEHRTPPVHICHFGNRNSGIQTAADALAVGIEDGEHCLLIGDQQFSRSVLQQLNS